MKMQQWDYKGQKNLKRQAKRTNIDEIAPKWAQIQKIKHATQMNFDENLPM